MEVNKKLLLILSLLLLSCSSEHSDETITLTGYSSESLVHANLAGEHITGLDGHPPLNINNIHETHKHDIVDILSESLEHEKEAIDMYYKLLKEVENNSIYLE